MTQSDRIGVLLFLDTRNELSDDEKTELSTWCREAPENEKLFRDLTSPDFMRDTLKGYYQRRGEVFQMLKQRLPLLYGVGLSNDPGFEDDDPVDKDYQEHFPEKQLAESGLTKIEFWKSMIPDMLLSEDDDEYEEMESDQSVPMHNKDHSIKKYRKLIIISLVAAASLVLGIIYYSGGFDSGDIYKGVMVFPDGTRYVLNELNRGRLAGLAGIRFETNEIGESVWVYGNQAERKKTESYSLASGAGKGFILRLPDGTIIRMNSESTISYPANFSQDTINLSLEGEAFFELSNHSSHHYLIRSKLKRQEILVTDAELKDQRAEFLNKGPQINISSYTSDSGLRATLIRGRVNIVNMASSQEIFLLPGQQIKLNFGMSQVSPAVDTARVIAWKNGNFDFSDDLIQNITPELERWYDLNVNYQGRIPEKRFTLQVSRSASLSEVLEILEKQGVHISKSGRKLTITF
jgi:ferric-dicitrate binding protein FerR (iron transport regulator)